MKRRILVLMILFGGLLISANFHKFYVSLCQVDHNQETGALEITMKIFTDDLEYAITGSSVFYGLGTEHESPEADSILYRYILRNFHIKVDGTLRNPVYIGKEVELDVTWCYIEIEEVGDFKTLEITNKMLTELFEDQANIVNVNVGGRISGVLLNGTNPTRSIDF